MVVYLLHKKKKKDISLHIYSVDKYDNIIMLRAFEKKIILCLRMWYYKLSNNIHNNVTDHISFIDHKPKCQKFQHLLNR